MNDAWNPWHGCRKYSEGCMHCYVYRRDALYGKDSSIVRRTSSFRLPVSKDRTGAWKVPSGSHLYACMTSDFFLDEADAWREEAWNMIRQRQDLSFTIITKRVPRMRECLPADWGNGWPNVEFGVTAENQRRAQERMDAFLSIPAFRRFVLCEPMLEAIDLSPWLASGALSLVIAGGESGPQARPLCYDWVLALREQCARAHVRFHFKQTGANFIKDGRRYHIERYLQAPQARRAKIDL